LSRVQVSAVLVTRGDVDLSPVLATLPFDDVVIWDKTKRPEDYFIWSRYVAMQEAKHDVVYVQDDDCLTDPAVIASQYRPGFITANVPPERRDFYRDGVTLIGWGSVFHRSMATVFNRYLKRWPMDELFMRECDRIFTGLNRCRNIDVPFEHLPHAHGSDRMGAEKRHLQDLAEVRRRIYELR
jgi:hypothetical protein